MRDRLILLAGIVVILLVGWYFYNKYRVAPAINFQNLELVTPDGRQVTLKDYESRYMLVCFSATWCQPCLNEIPALIKAQDLLAENDVMVVLVSDESGEAVKRLWQKTSESLPVLRSAKKFRELEIATIPTTYLLNGKREILFKKTGEENWADNEMIAKLRMLAQ